MQLMATVGDLMENYDQCLEIAKQGVLEMIIISISKATALDGEERGALVEAWLHLVIRTVKSWTHLWYDFHQNLSSILWAIAGDYLGMSSIISSVCFLLMRINELTGCHVEPSVEEAEKLFIEEGCP